MIKNRKKYYPYILRTTLLLAAAMFVLQLLTRFSLISVALFLVVEFIILSEKFTENISINSDDLVIKYFQFLKSKKISIPLFDADLKKYKVVAFRSSGYYKLNISINKKNIHELDSRNGFYEEDFDKIIELARYS